VRSNDGPVATRRIAGSSADKISTEQRYYISSQKRLPAKTALATFRAHWGIENRLHWVLDLAFREDDCRIWAANAADCRVSRAGCRWTADRKR
jgi:predicted transposase YbfD/YdcC